MQRAALVALLLLPLGGCGGPLKHPPRQRGALGRLAHHTLWDRLGVRQQLHSTAQSPALGRSAHALDVQPEGSQEGLRILQVADWLTNRSRTCLPLDAAARGSRVSGLTGLGEKRCPSGTLTIPRESGDDVNVTSAGSAASVAAAALQALIEAGGTEEQAAALAAQYPELELLCAQYHADPQSHADALATCKANGGTLITMSAESTERTIQRYVLERGTYGTIWTGLRVLDASTRPVATAWESRQSTAAWNQRWNVPPGSGSGFECCPGVDTAFGDATCVHYDTHRHRDGLRPYVVTDCTDRRPFFCEIATEFYDPKSGGPVQVTRNDPAFFYSPQDPHTVRFYDRRPGAQADTFELACSAEHIMDGQKRMLLSTVLTKTTRYLSMLLAPRRRQSGAGPITGNQDGGRTVQCHHPYFTFDLARYMTVADATTDPPTYHLPDVDLVVIVTAIPDQTDLAWSFPCATGADLRPNVIVLNVAPNKLAAVAQLPRGAVKLRNRLLASCFHALGFHDSLFASWQQPVVNASVETPSCKASNAFSCRNVTLVVTPAVKAWVHTKQFRCDGNPDGGSGLIGGAELEDGMVNPAGQPVVLPYWEKRVFRGEILTVPTDIAEDRGADVAVISGLTLAAFQDMGWYVVNHLMEQELKWGRLQRCEFATQDCDQWPDRYKFVPPNPLGPQELQCAPDFLGLAATNVVTWPDREVPSKFRWMGTARPNEGGSDPVMDFCPIKQPVQRSCLQQLPQDEDCQVVPCRRFQVRGASSRCFMATLRYKAFERKVNTSDTTPSVQAAGAPLVSRGTCLPTECQLGIAGWLVRIWVGGTQFTCSSRGEQVGPSKANSLGVQNSANYTILGTITCPDPRELCTQAGSDVAEKACDPIEDCNGNGYCDWRTGGCACFNSTTLPGPDPLRPHIGSRGFFAGPRCGRCESGYYGWPHCRSKQCGVDPDTGVMCYGHGTCNGVTGVCTCNNDEKGHWDPSTACSTCSQGWVGGECQIPQCTTDAECGQGTCVYARGLCRCHRSSVAGYWTGLRCDRCVDGYDPARGCRVRHAAYFGCDSTRADDCGLAARPAINCTGCADRCRAKGKQSTVCKTPQRIPTEDGRGCPVDGRIPLCTSQVTQCGACPVPSPVRIDCNGYPNLYTTCWIPDDCGCLPPVFVQCETGTEAAPSPTAYDFQIAGPNGVFDVRGASVPTSTKTCRCQDGVPPPDFDCWGPLNGAVPGYAKGRVVFFEPRQYQIIEEDFCHCTSPRVPGCTDATKPYRLPELVYGRPVDCTSMLNRTGCPDWAVILNVDQKHDPQSPDLSVVDCVGWPAPRLLASVDPCGCPLPQFRCRDGTRGECAEKPECPEWPDRIEVDCGGHQPPVLKLHAPHPCGCPPPPPIACRANTGPCCECDYPPQETVWVDCGGVPLDPVAWHPDRRFERGDPFVQPCDPCPHCIPPPPLRRCIPGTSTPRPRSQNAVSHCPGSPPDLSQCPKYPPPCPVDCQGAPPAPPADEDSCGCPPPPQPGCLPGTYGPGSVTDRDIPAVPCESNPTVCGGYACASASADLGSVAGRIGVQEGSWRECAGREPVWSAAPGAKLCLRTCDSDLMCACGYKCSVCGLCVPLWWPEPPAAAGGNCLADGGASCGRYACEVKCNDAEGLRRVLEEQVVSARCLDACRSHADCRADSVCNLAAFSVAESIGAQDQVLGERTRRTAEAVPKGIPGFNVRATPVPRDSDELFEPLREEGECVAAEEPQPQGTLYCASHDDCGGYACGSDRHQVFFSSSRCRSSCWVTAHCHSDYRCQRHSGRCVPVVSKSAADGDCKDDPSGDLTKYGGCTELIDIYGCQADLHQALGLRPGTTLAGLCKQSCAACTAVNPPCSDDPEELLSAYGATPAQRCENVKAALTCAGDVTPFVQGVPQGTTVLALCAYTCGACEAVQGAGRKLLQTTTAPSSGTSSPTQSTSAPSLPTGVTAEPSATPSAGPSSAPATASPTSACSSDPRGVLDPTYGATGHERCAYVLRTLQCGDGTQPVGGSANVTVAEVCPAQCSPNCTTGAPTAANATPPTAGPSASALASEAEDPCQTGHDSRSGATSEERCVALSGCCYRSDFDLCYRCSTGGVFETAGRVDAESPGCETQAADFCSPYACGGHIGAHPAPGSSCPTSCHSDDGCQPFHLCEFPTLADLEKRYGGSTKFVFDSVTGRVLSQSSSQVGSLRLEREAAVNGGPAVGRCVKSAALLRQRQTPLDVEMQRRRSPFVSMPSLFRLPPKAAEVTLLRVPVGHLSGLQQDPQSVRFYHAPFPPPPPTPRPPADLAVQGSAAECFPYVAVSAGIVAEQMQQLRKAALAGTPEAGTGLHQSLPGCRTSCTSDADCAGGYFCTVAARKEEIVSKSGKRVVAGGDAACTDPDMCLGDQEQVFSEPQMPHPRQPAKGTCQRLRSLGTACNHGGECGSGFCAEGICCNTDCKLPCQTCTRMGVCGWVPPRTDPTKRCEACHWCDYVPDRAGRLSPASPLGCRPIAYGLDPSSHCPDRGVCNGEGACMPTEHRFGGDGGTCSLGFSGPDCATSSVSYRTAVAHEPLTVCSPVQTAAAASSPELPQPHAVASACRQAGSSTTTVSSRAAGGGFSDASVPTHHVRRLRVIDRRPRQWAQRVLAVSAHSQYGCSQILYEPSAADDERVHGVTDSAWAPPQYVWAPGTSDRPDLQWWPWANCSNQQTEGTCNTTHGCRWGVAGAVAGGYCTGDGRLSTMQDLEAYCMEQQGCTHDQQPLPGSGKSATSCGEVWPSCRMATTAAGTAPTYDKSRISPMPLQWIELEFAVAVHLEAVILHENSVPGSLVRIEAQPAPTGSAALAAAGGAALQTDAAGNILSRPAARAVVTPEQIATTVCGAYGSQGESVCAAKAGCAWDSARGECTETEGLCAVGRSQCTVLQERGKCYWDDGTSRCFYGRPCLQSTTFRPNVVAAGCASLTTKDACSSDPEGRCRWEVTEVSQCRGWDVVDDCAQYTERTACDSQRRGLTGDPNRRYVYCNWDAASGTCSERRELHNCTHWNGVVTDTANCNASVDCVLPTTSGATCQSRNTSTAACSGFSQANCISCALSGMQQGCSMHCAWEITSAERCVPFDTDACSTLAYTECSATAACRWVGQAPATTPSDSAAPLTRTAAPLSEAELGRRAAARELRQRGSVPHPGLLRRTRDVYRDRDLRVRDHDFGRINEAVAALHRSRSATVLQDAGNASGAAVGTEVTLSTATTVGDIDASPELLAALGQYCQLNYVSALSRRMQNDSDTTDYKSICEAKQDRASCLATKTWRGEPNVCRWPSQVAEVTPASGIPNAPISEWADLGGYGVAEAPTGFRWRDMAPRFPAAEAMPSKAETQPTPADIPCEQLPAGGSDPLKAGSLNTNRLPFEVVWERSWPNFPLRRRYRELSIDVGRTETRTKVLRLWFAPTAEGRSQIDAVAIVGAARSRTAAASNTTAATNATNSTADPTPDSRQVCKGEVWASPVRDGMPSTAMLQRGTVWAVPCGGRGFCGPYGCECFGRFFGEGCQTCKFGYTGTGCDTKLNYGCRVVAAEDVALFDDEAEVRARWGFRNYRQWTSPAVHYKHFGSVLTSPRYDLGDRTHIRLDIGTLLVDVQKGQGDCGVEVAGATDRNATDHQILFTRPCKYFTGINLIGNENGDLIDYFTVLRRWPHKTISLRITLWSDVGTETPVFTLTDMVLRSCRYVDIKETPEGG